MTLFPGQVERRVESAWDHDGRLVLKLEGVDSISAAEQLRGCEVCVPKQARIPAGEGEYFYSDLVGFELTDFESGEQIGVVDGWSETGGPVLLEAGEVLVPFAASIIRDIDAAARRIRVTLPEGLRELNQ